MALMIILKNVSKRFGKDAVLTDISFQISPSELVCITGPSGAGKSTLIHLLTGAERVSDGQIEVDGVDLRRVPFPVMQIYRRRVGVVFQDYKLLNNRTVWENVAFPLQVCGVPKSNIEERVKELLDKMLLSERGDALPASLSGGEKARVAIARAVVHKPMIVMADEPTGNIDPIQSEMILNLFRDINSDGTTVIFATHDTGLVDALQTRVVRLEDGRMVRDSFGGYEQETESPDVGEASEHHVFSGVEEKIPKKKTDEGGESVPITSTNS